MGATNGSTQQEDSTGLAEPVGVVLVTHNRPELMRKTLASILAQEYAGDIQVVIVFDRSEPDTSLVQDDPHRSVRVMANSRTPGLAGGRNTGILELSTELIAFCDDDDTWAPTKLTRQVERLHEQPDAEFVTTAMRVIWGDTSTIRVADRSEVTITDLARSRMAMLHSSSFLFRKSAMVDGFGLVDETLPRSMAEDWDLLIRAARRRPIQHVDEPLIDVLWGQTSYFNDAWHDKNVAHQMLLDQHPEIRADKIGAGLQYGKLTFGHAAVGERRQALHYARRGFRTNWKEPRTVLGLLVVAGVPPEWIQRKLNERGRGI